MSMSLVGNKITGTNRKTLNRINRMNRINRINRINRVNYIRVDMY